MENKERKIVFADELKLTQAALLKQIRDDIAESDDSVLAMAKAYALITYGA